MLYRPKSPNTAFKELYVVTRFRYSFELVGNMSIAYLTCNSSHKWHYTKEMRIQNTGAAKKGHLKLLFSLFIFIRGQSYLSNVTWWYQKRNVCANYSMSSFLACAKTGWACFISVSTLPCNSCRCSFNMVISFLFRSLNVVVVVVSGLA